jgi:hypothetical protein
MTEKLIEKLSQISIERGSTPNEEAIAKEKMAKYSAVLNAPGPAARPMMFEDIRSDEQKPLHEQRFLNEWHKLKNDNRKKWKAE